MTTKEEVLKLAEAAGFIIQNGKIFYPATHVEDNSLTIRLIELAKQAGAAEERARLMKENGK